MPPAVLGTARLGNFRLGYSELDVEINATRVSILLAGVEVRTRVRRDGFSVHHALGDSPSTCGLTFDGAAPVGASRLRVTINRATPRLLFAGALQTVNETYEGLPSQLAYPCTAIDDTARANRRRPFGTWTSTSASTIALAICATCLPDYDTTGIVAGLPDVSVNLDGSEGVSGAFQQLATLIGGYWRIEDLAVFLFQTDTSDAPDPIDASHPFLHDPPITMTSDDSQLLTRAFGKGHGDTASKPAAAGASTLELSSVASAWFNASGGHVISDTQIMSYAGLGLGYLGDPTVWTTRAGGSPTQQWTGIAWSPALGLFAAVSGSGSSLGVMTSSDGITWTTRTPHPTTAWSGITWAPALNLFVAVGSGAVMTSPDGITWTSRTPATADGWYAVAWAPSLTLLVAVANSGTVRVMTSPDGVTWTSRTAAAALQWQSVIWAPALGLFAALGAGGVANGIMTSPDGITWTQRTAAAAAFTSVAWSPTLGLFVGFAGGSSVTSSDGITWTLHASVLASANWYVIWTDWPAFVAIGDNAGGASGIAISTDGLTWTTTLPPFAGGWRALAWAPAIGTMAAVGFTGTPTSLIMSNTATNVHSVLTGIPTSGVGSIAVPILAGAPVNIWVQRDDAVAQASQAAIDTVNGRTPADGIYEGPPIVDERRNEASLTALCDAHLALYASPIIAVTYDTRDVKTKVGKTVHIDLASPAIGPIDLVIQSVDISEIDITPRVAPRFHVLASTVRYSLPDLLRRLLAA